MSKRGEGSSLRVVPCTCKDALAFVSIHHRHHKRPSKMLFAVAVADANERRIRGVAIVGQPVARMLEDGWTAEVVRVATDGASNACSMLYGSAWRGAGWQCVGQRGGGSWDREGRPRVDRHPTQVKIRWERNAHE